MIQVLFYRVFNVVLEFTVSFDIVWDKNGIHIYWSRPNTPEG